MFSQHYRLFWSSNVGNFVSRNKDERINRSYLEHPLAKKMRLGHAHVGLKHMYDCVLKAVVTYILLENLGSKKRIKWSIDRLRADIRGQKQCHQKDFTMTTLSFCHFGNLQSLVVLQLQQLCKSYSLSV